ncbi:hypothetical protein LXL04_012860 [Taraxacum kok-saghyz]
MENPVPSYTEIERSKLEAITPSQFIEFTVPNTLHNRLLLDDPVVRVCVCDSPLADPDDESPIIAAMIVPKNGETEWYYDTEFGHMQLLFKFRNVSRLILIGSYPNRPESTFYKRPPVTDTDTLERENLQNELKPLLLNLHPKVSSTSNNGSPETIFLTDNDDVAYRVTIDSFLGRTVDAIHVEDVQLVNNQLRRRMRFRRMPYLVQSEAILVPKFADDEGTTQTDLESLREIDTVKFEADTSVLVHQYLIAMVSGLFLIPSYLNSLFCPKALCLGVGGGVLLSFLDNQMDFIVTGVEVDEMVLSAAKQHFGLNKSKCIRLIVGDAIETVQNFPPRSPKDKKEIFDVVFVDLYSIEAKDGCSAPPPEFVTKPVLEGLRSLLHANGVLIMNVVPPNELFYTTLVEDLKEFFHKIYEINVENEDNFVVMATVSPPSSSSDNDNILKKLKSLIPGTYLDSIVEFGRISQFPFRSSVARLLSRLNDSLRDHRRSSGAPHRPTGAPSTLLRCSAPTLSSSPVPGDAATPTPTLRPSSALPSVVPFFLATPTTTSFRFQGLMLVFMHSEGCKSILNSDDSIWYSI